MRRLFFFIVIAAVLTACEVHVKAPENGVLIPGGEPVLVTLISGEPLEGELLLVTLTDLVLNTQGRNLAVDFSRIYQVKIKRYGLTLNSGWWEKLPPYSRYPKGLPAEQRQLLKIDVAPIGFPDKGNVNRENTPVLVPIIAGRPIELKPGDVVLAEIMGGRELELTITYVSKSNFSAYYRSSSGNNVVGNFDNIEITKMTIIKRGE